MMLSHAKSNQTNETLCKGEACNEFMKKIVIIITIMELLMDFFNGIINNNFYDGHFW